MSDDDCATMEINFRLDQEGRTARQIQSEGNDEASSAQHPTIRNDRRMDYDTNVAFISRLLPDNLALMDDLLLDCEISDCGLMPRTFWVPADATPRFRLEQLALATFRHHVMGNYSEPVDFDMETSGAEWWVQLRPSPEKTGRYAMFDHGEQSENEAGGSAMEVENARKDTVDMSKSGISFHWDKDEELRLLTDGSLNLHPHLSTVTYLTDLGCPTLVLNFRVDSFTGAWMAPTTPEGVVAWPKQGKHLSFDGRFLHAAPPDLMEEGVFEQTCQLQLTDVMSAGDEKKERRRRRRATFLVNIWLNYRPVQVDPFPDTMVDKMSRDPPDSENSSDWGFVGSDKSTDRFVRIDNDTLTSSDTTITRLTWPMGDCNSHEIIQANMPLQVIQEAGRHGANVRLQWNIGACVDEGTLETTDDPLARPGIGLYRGKSNADESTVLTTNGVPNDVEIEDDQGLKRKRQ